jgi:hypothetical protein
MFVKMPNGRILEVNNNNFFSTKIEISLSEAIKRDLNGFRQFIAGMAVGSPHVSRITYELKGVTPGGLAILQVSGSVGPMFEMGEGEIVDESMLVDELYDVEVCRIGYGVRTITVRGRNDVEAEKNAREVAGNYEYTEHASDYDVTSVVKRK